MTIAIVHISDLHLKSKQIGFESILDKMARSLCAYEVTVTDVILAVTGDIAFSGKQAEYTFAQSVINNWRVAIKAAGLTAHVVIVPGNHDCDFCANTGARDVLVACAKNMPDKVDESMIVLCSAVQSHYADFVQNVGIKKEIVENLQRTGYACQIVTTTSGSIAFHLLNTALCSQFNEQPSALVVPSLTLQGVRRVGGCLCEVTLMHHALQWLEPNNAREVRSVLDRVSEFAFTGHDHCSGLRGSTDITKGLSVTMSEGAVLFDGDGKVASAFTVLLVDPVDKLYGFDKRVWENEQYHSVSTPISWSKLCPEAKDGCRRLVLRNTWNETITDPGASFRHPRVSRLHMADLYIAPDLQEMGDGGKRKDVSARELSFEGVDPCHILLTGVSQSGKTTICYQVFEQSYRAGLIPVYLNIADVRVKTMADFQKAVEKAFVEQYADANVDSWRELSKPDRVIIADNVHRLCLNSKHRQRLLQTITSTYPKVMFTGDPLLSLEELTDNNDVETSGDVSWRTLQILPFSNVLRSDLITRWIELGQDKVHPIG